MNPRLQMQIDAIRINAARRRTESQDIGGDGVRVVPFIPLEDQLILALKKQRWKNADIAEMLGASVNAIRFRMQELKKTPAG